MKTSLHAERLHCADNWGREQSMRWLSRVILVGGVLLVCNPVNGAGNGADTEGGADFCQETSRTVLLSCQAGTLSDNLLALSKPQS